MIGDEKHYLHDFQFFLNKDNPIKNGSAVGLLHFVCMNHLLSIPENRARYLRDEAPCNFCLIPYNTPSIFNHALPSFAHKRRSTLLRKYLGRSPEPAMFPKLEHGSGNHLQTSTI